ncbi:hypothetical protein BDF19DRAFT_435230 [Syncephalis fuscata]|nr:hypothetical protein BDF19DRAFT_435230 [Syncephalis fuscata]
MTVARLAHLLYGTIIQPKSLNKLDIVTCALLGVYHSGRIAFIERDATTEQFEKMKEKYAIDKITCLSNGQFILPGFIDTHLHAPQYTIIGNGIDLQLLEWLETYTFPEEARYKDESYALKVYKEVVKHTLKTGTTCAAYFGTIHTAGSQRLVDVMRSAGQRGWVGKESIQGTRQLIEYIKQIDEAESKQMATKTAHDNATNNNDYYQTVGLVEPCITPRFAPTCSAESLQQMGKIAAEENLQRERNAQEQLPIQTHLSENRAEIKWVASLFPETSSYTDVYDRAGLLSQRTIMAHCVHLSPEERRRLKETGTSVSHCAHSNFDLRSGVLNVRQLLDEGIKVGLGTDLAGGHSSSMLEAIRSALTASRMVCILEADKHANSDSLPDDTVLARSQLSVPEALYLATVGGASAMGLHSKVGNLLQPGYEFDALLIDIATPNSPVKFFEPESTNSHHDNEEPVYLRRLEKFLMCGDDRNILNVWVRGRQVSGTTHV